MDDCGNENKVCMEMACTLPNVWDLLSLNQQLRKGQTSFDLDSLLVRPRISRK